MTITELENKRVKLSAGTITVKDEANKTRGMVRGIRQFAGAAPCVQSTHFKALKTSGIWGLENSILNRVYIVDNKLYLLRDLGYEDRYNRYFAGRGFEADDKRFNMLQRVYQNAEKEGITVIPCTIC